MSPVQAIPLRPTLIIEHYKLGIRNEVGADHQDLGYELREHHAHVAAAA
jgi:hypothetical protein